MADALPQKTTELDEAQALNQALNLSARDELLKAWQEKDSAQFHKHIMALHTSDIALVLGQIRPDERVGFIQKVRQKQLVPVIILALDNRIKLEILQQLPLKTIANYLEFLESDDKLAMIEDVAPAMQGKLLALLAPKIRADLVNGLQFAPDTAGRIMRREFISVPETWQVGEVIDYLRSKTATLPEFHNIMIMNKKFAPVGLLKVSKLLASKRVVAVRDIMNEDAHSINADMAETDIVQIFRKYGLVENPVVSDKGVLIGTITIDDVIAIADEQAEDDLLSLVGVSEHGFQDNVLTTTRRRGSWLMVNLLTAILASIFIGIFEGALEQIVALAILMPIIASMGGNAGMQTLAVTIRAITLGYLTPAIRRKLIFKEICVGFLTGIGFALLAALLAYLWFKQADLSLVIAIAMLVNLVIATVSGSLVPLLLAAYGQDPTTGSAVVLTTITDIVGFCMFLGLASWLLL